MPNYSQQFYEEPELIALLKMRKREGFNYLYDKYSAALYSVISRRISDKHAALDILQEVFISIWKGIDSYDADKGRFYTWMHKIAINKTLDFQNSRLYSVRTKSKEILPDTTLLIQQKTNIIGVKKLVDKLLPKYNVVVQLFYFNGYTLKEIAADLNIPLGTVKTRLRYALCELRKDHDYRIPAQVMNEYALEN